MIRITAMKWVPGFAAGQVRDHRLRWILEEVGWPYEVELVDAPTLASDAYRARQPYGQVPVLEEDGLPTLFESGAIILDVALRADALLPADAGQRSLAICWLVSALNSLEPFLMNVAEVEWFTRDEAAREQRRPVVVKAAKRRLGMLRDALGDRTWLAGDAFSVADLMTSSVLKIAQRLQLLDEFPSLEAYAERCFERPAHRKAIADQRAVFDAHDKADMHYDRVRKD